MSTVGGKFTAEKRNLVTYIENKDYERLRKLAALHGRSVSAEAAMAIQKYLLEHVEELEKENSKK